MNTSKWKIIKFAPLVSVVLVTGLLLFFVVGVSGSGNDSQSRNLFMASPPFVSPPPTSSVLTSPLSQQRPSSWVSSKGGGTKGFGPIILFFSPGFTRQGGANVFADLHNTRDVPDPSELLDSANLKVFSIGIWPPNDQVEFENPVEIRFDFDSSLIPAETAHSMTLMVYNAEVGAWQFTPARYDEGLNQLVARVTIFTPVAKYYPTWGGRTFFAIVENAEYSRVIRNSNLRAGPGLQYSVVGGVKSGEFVIVVAEDKSGDWYQIDTGEWIASFLIERAP